MRTLIFLLLLSCSLLSSAQSVQFSEANIETGTIGFIQSIVADDFTGNGYPDVITFDATIRDLSFYQNLGGSFAEKIVIQESISAFELKAFDVDDDGRVDIVYNGPFDPTTWQRNLGGGTFDEPIELTIANGVITFADVNLDSRDDIIITQKTGMTFLRNNGNGEFEYTAGANTSGRPNFFESVLTDLQPFDKLDLITYSADDGLMYFSQDDDGDYAEGHIIDSTYADLFPYEDMDSHLIDFNSDGYKDLLISRTDEGTIYFHESNSDIVFDEKISLITGINGIDRFELADLDLDGDFDIVFNSYEIQGGWYENMGDMSFTGPYSIFFSEDVSDDVDTRDRIVLTDINQDGLMDVLMTDGFNFDWHLNLGSASAIEYVNDLSIRVSPNPSNNFSIINFPYPAIWELNVFNQMGFLVKNASTNVAQYSLDTSDLPRGVYFVRVSSEDVIVAPTKLVVTD